MNMIVFEIKRRLVPVLIWAVAICLALWGFVAGAYPYYERSTAAIRKVMEGFPKGFDAFFGVDIQILFSFGGFYNFVYTYISLLAAIFMLYLGISLFSEEKRAGCTDFLMTKPLSREMTFANKTAAGLLMLILVSILYGAVNLALYVKFSNEIGVTVSHLLLGSLSMGMTGLVFYGIGIMYATVVNRVRSVGGTATLLGFAFFILSAVIELLDQKVLNYFALLRYFAPYTVFSGGTYQADRIAAGAVVLFICLVISCNIYVRRDVKAM